MLSEISFVFVNKNSRFSWILKAIWLLCILGVVYYFFSFLYITSMRITYPFALEWMEGTSLVQVQRILFGKPIYIKPSLDYVPLIYPPLYFYISAAFAKFLGFSFFSLRLVSLIASIGSTLFIYLIVKRQTHSILPALLSAGFFAGTFKLSGAWFDIARVDMLALFFMLAAVYLASYKEALPLFFSGILITLACLTKQTYLPILITLCGYFLLFRRERALLAISSAVLSYVLTAIFLNVLHDGWYKFFVYEIPSSHGLFTDPGTISNSLRIFLVDHIIKPLPILVLLFIFYLWDLTRHFKTSFQKDMFLLPGITVAAFVLSWMALANPGSYLNILLPAHAMLAIISGLGLDKALNSDKRVFISGMAGLLCLLQFALLYYPIQPQIPSTENLMTANSLLNRIKREPGDVYVPYHPELSLFAEKRPFASWISLLELSGGFGGEEKNEWREVSRELVQALKKNKFSLIILDMDPFFGHPELYYSSSPMEFTNGNTLYPVTGVIFQPAIIYYKTKE